MLAGCNKSKSPEDVSKDVAKAEQKANNEVTKSEERALSALDKSYEKVNDQEIKFNNDAAHQTYNVAIADPQVPPAPLHHVLPPDLQVLEFRQVPAGLWVGNNIAPRVTIGLLPKFWQLLPNIVCE